MLTYREIESRCSELVERLDNTSDCLDEIVQMSKLTTLNYFSVERILKKYNIDHIFK